MTLRTWTRGGTPILSPCVGPSVLAATRPSAPGADVERASSPTPTGCGVWILRKVPLAIAQLPSLGVRAARSCSGSLRSIRADASRTPHPRAIWHACGGAQRRPRSNLDRRTDGGKRESMRPGGPPALRSGMLRDGAIPTPWPLGETRVVGTHRSRGRPDPAGGLAAPPPDGAAARNGGSLYRFPAAAQNAAQDLGIAPEDACISHGLTHQPRGGRWSWLPLPWATCTAAG
jgi:hypothetical protein